MNVDSECERISKNKEMNASKKLIRVHFNYTCNYGTLLSWRALCQGGYSNKVFNQI